jgi:catechol 2,3-dioxygenase-like lactoylglutathione lyase family enzyme
MRLYRVILPVGDIDAASRFYEALLGVSGQRVSPGRHYLETGGTILALVDPRADGQNRDARPNQEHVYFSTTELSQARTRAITAEPLDGPTEIRDMPWGERSFYLGDPWGNPLCIVEAGSEFTEGWVG